MMSPLPLVLLLLGGAVDAGVLMWGSQDIQIPSLKRFDNEDFELLRAYLRNPEVIVFRGNPMQISEDLQELLKNKYTAYIPSVDLDLRNVIELKGAAKENFATIKDKIQEYDGENVLALIVSTTERIKRQTDNSTEVDISEESENEPPSGPMLYSANGKAMVYSAKPPILEINESTYILGKDAITTTDVRNKTLGSININIPVDGMKVMLKFKFTWLSGYWTLNVLEVITTKTYILNVTEYIGASKNFSYHCGGRTTFADDRNGVQVSFFDFQMQPDTQDGRFNDAYDCVNFMTTPIWSGLFVTSIIMIGLAIGLNAMNSIKTMDKFDNYKTKQLSITTSD